VETKLTGDRGSTFAFTLPAFSLAKSVRPRL